MPYTREIWTGDCLTLMPAMLPDNSVDSIVTDPPYGLGFMGKKWDIGVPAVEVFEQCLRVLKPGGHLLAFGGSRTYHRLAVAVEDAGFEIRDQIMWVYGSGFPKSLDVSKAIDKIDATEKRKERRYSFTKWMVGACDLTASEMDEVCGTNTMGRHWTDVPPNGKQPDVPTRENFEALRPHIRCDVPDWIEALVDERTVDSKEMRDTQAIRIACAATAAGYDARARRTVDITAAHTESARQWAGWGTALKPAHEPIVVARKPLAKGHTVAENVLEHGTGAINVDGCRIDAESGGRPLLEVSPLRHDVEYSGNALAGRVDGSLRTSKAIGSTSQGRWPANLIHDGSDEVLACFPDAKGQAGAVGPQHGPRSSINCYGDYGPRPHTPPRIEADKSAARFFYCAKASKVDRGETNTHPTVKPTALMRYLCRLVTPPGGLILDPFAGSGSTGMAAILEGFRFVGFELDPEYAEIARARVHAAVENYR